MRKRWAPTAGQEPATGPVLGQRRITGSVTLDALARGQLVTRVARRRANRLVVLGEGRGGLTSLTPQSGDYSVLPPAIATRVAELDRAWRARPPRLLRPALLAEDVHAFAVTEVVSEPVYLPGAQRLVAGVLDADGAPLRVSRPFRAVAPAALDHLTRALTGGYGPVRFITGEVRRTLRGFELEPLAVVADRIIVPDLEREPLETSLPMGREPPPASPLENAIATGLGVLDEAAHHGLERAAPTLSDRASAAGKRAGELGLSVGGNQLALFAAQLVRARAAGTDDGWREAARTWTDAAITFLLCRERL
jgi:hypothetical protein